MIRNRSELPNDFIQPDAVPNKMRSMKLILTFTLIIFNQIVFGQSLFFNEFKVINIKVPRSSESYESRIIKISDHDTLIKKTDYPIDLEWNPINEN